MTLSEQVDSLQARFADLKTSLDASRKETSERLTTVATQCGWPPASLASTSLRHGMTSGS